MTSPEMPATKVEPASVGPEMRGEGAEPASVTPTPRENAGRAGAEGPSPLDVMLETMRFHHEKAVRLSADAEADPENAKLRKEATDARNDALDAAKNVAPYLHPRLSSIEAETERTVRYVASVPETSPDTQSWLQQHAPRP